MNARDLLAAATPRPWAVDPACPNSVGGDLQGDEGEWGATVIENCDPEDARLIVAAVNEYEALLDLEAAFRDAGVSMKRFEWWPRVYDALARLDAVRSGA